MDRLEIQGKVNTAICYARVVEDEAIEQIKTRDYGNILPQKELIRIAAVFNASPTVRSITVFSCL